MTNHVTTIRYGNDLLCTWGHILCDCPYVLWIFFSTLWRGTDPAETRKRKRKSRKIENRWSIGSGDSREVGVGYKKDKQGKADIEEGIRLGKWQSCHRKIGLDKGEWWHSNLEMAAPGCVSDDVTASRWTNGG